MRIWSQWVVIILLCLPGVISCDSKTDVRNVDLLLSRLSSENEQVRDSARQASAQFLWLKSDLPKVYTALSRSFPDDTRKDGTKVSLLRVLQAVHDDKTSAEAAKLVKTLENYPHLQLEALLVLSHINTPEALEELKALLLPKPPESAGNLSELLAPLVENPQHLNVLFPDLFGLAKEPVYRLAVIESLRAGLESGVISNDLLGNLSTKLLAIYEEVKINLSADPLEGLAIAEQLIPVMIQQDSLRQHLEKSSPESPEWKLMVTLALWGHHQQDSILVPLAENIETRMPLFRWLESHDRLQAFPPSFYTQELMALADLADWLHLPENKDAYPKSIKIQERISVDSLYPGKVAYLIRYKYPREKWETGISGPFSVDSKQVDLSSGLTGYWTGK